MQLLTQLLRSSQRADTITDLVARTYSKTFDTYRKGGEGDRTTPSSNSIMLSLAMK